MTERILEVFQDLFSQRPLIAFAPGRINLIGEHTDYQEGLVFPAAVEQGIFVAIGRNQKGYCRLYSLDFDEEYTFSLDSISPQKGHWVNYVMGMLSQLKQAGFAPQSFDMVIGGTIPVGAGLSSSAALSIAIGTAITSLFNYQVSKKSLVLYAQKSEHLYAGVNCGIMDPYASAFGKKSHALLLDCRSNSHEEIPINLGHFGLVLVNSKVKHSLTDSAYNKRGLACEDSVNILKSEFPEIKTLRDIDISDLEKIEKILPQKLFPKAKHVISENHRVSEAAESLLKGDLANFGQLMNSSHESLSTDFEVSCAELDFLAAKAQSLPYILGSRMMGGGFGGCTLNLIDKKFLVDFKIQIQNSYQKQFGIIPDFIEVELSDGASVIHSDSTSF
ncbi:MAG: galactokinase [Algoriphagus sp.]|uniref:galactokinase n=1 Tax=Algoriphagus sp. TaxID=1872435 RepID=UPI002626E47F|nr:galactokinase [Algoriphagus sp.]MDG1277880.1 galactokinase [Algoriphagus sp.]